MHWSVVLLHVNVQENDLNRPFSEKDNVKDLDVLHPYFKDPVVYLYGKTLTSTVSHFVSPTFPRLRASTTS